MPNKFLEYAVCIFLSRIVLRKLTATGKVIFRKLEDKSKKYVTHQADIKFINFCIINRLLPKFVQNARNEESSTDSKISRLQREIIKKQKDLIQIQEDTIRLTIQLQRAIPKLYFYSCIEFLKRTLKSLESDTALRHEKKLRNLYHGDIFMKSSQDNVINLSSHELDHNEWSLLQKGLSFGIKPEHDPLFKKIQVEKLFNNIKYEESKQSITIENEENLKTKMKTFSISHLRDDAPNPLTKDDFAALKSLQKNPNIVIQRSDKGRCTVVMNTSDYISKLRHIISDESKFVKCKPNTTETTKKKVNEVVSKIQCEPLRKKLKRVGEYSNGHLYGLPKIHKNTKDPPSAL